MGAPTGAIRAGRSYVEMFADPSALFRTLDAAKKRVLAFGQFAGKIGIGMAGIGTAAIAPIARLFADAVGEGANVNTLSKRWGMTAESVSTLKGAFAQAGMSGEDFGNTMDELSSKINEAAYSNEKLWNSASAPSGAALWGKDKQEQLYAFADAFSKLSDKAEQVDIAKKFGMLPLIEQLRGGRAAFKALQDAAIANGDAMNADDVKAAAEIQKEFNRVMLSVRSTLLEVGKALLPTGGSYASFGRDIRDALGSARDWIKMHREVIVAATAVAVGFVVIGFAISSIGVAALAIIPALTALKISLAIVNALAAPLTGTFGAAVFAGVALAGALALVWTQTEHGQAALAELKTAFGEFAEWIKGSWQGISDALSAGDWTLAFKIGIATADAAWKGFVYGLTAAWVGFKDVFVDTFRAAISGMKLIANDFCAFFEKLFTWELKTTLESASILIAAFDEELSLKLANAAGALKSSGQIELERKGREKKIVGEYIKAEDEADKAHKSVDDLEKAFVDALLGLEDLKRQAAKEAKEAGNRPWGGGGDWGGEEELPWFDPKAAKGMFGSDSIQQSLGYGDDIGQRQLAETQRIGDGVAEGNGLLRVIADKPGAKFT